MQEHQNLIVTASHENLMIATLNYFAEIINSVLFGFSTLGLSEKGKFVQQRKSFLDAHCTHCTHCTPIGTTSEEKNTALL